MKNNSSQGGLLPQKFDEAARFLDILAGKDTPYTFQTFDDVKVWSDEKKKFVNRDNGALAKIFHGTFDQHKEALARLNQLGAGVYVTINQTDFKGRSEPHITNVRAVFVDLDGSPLQPILDLPEELQPHLIIESSPERWHAYWLVNDCPLEQFKTLQQALIAKFDGDKAVCDLPRVMRLAGFIHNKDASKPFITRIVTMQDSLMRFSVNRLIDGLGLSQAPAKPLTSNKSNYTFNTDSINEVDPFNGACTQETIEDLRDALRYIPAFDYHEWLKVCMSLKSLDNDAGLPLFIEYSQKCSEKYDYNECRKKWSKIEPTRTGYKAIFADAQKRGWQNPAKRVKSAPVLGSVNSKTNIPELIAQLPTAEARTKASTLYSALGVIQHGDSIYGKSLDADAIIGYALAYE